MQLVRWHGVCARARTLTERKALWQSSSSTSSWFSSWSVESWGATRTIALPILAATGMVPLMPAGAGAARGMSNLGACTRPVRMGNIGGGIITSTSGTMIKTDPARGVRAVGVLLAVVLLASGCGPSLHPLRQACLASWNAQSAECVEYQAKAQQAHAATLTGRNMPLSASMPGYPSPGGQPRRSGR